MGIRVVVPASTSNLGAGFDSLGMAFALYNAFDTEQTQSGLELIVDERAKPYVRPGEQHLFVRHLRQVCAWLDYPLDGLRVRTENGIPFAGGLGNSATCAVAAVLTADAWTGGKLGFDARLDLCARLEGHPDNALPELCGGITVACREGERIGHIRIDPPAGLKAALFIPQNITVSTAQARRILPDRVKMSDAVYNLSHASLTVAALAQGRFDLLGLSVKDRLHQPYRLPLIPGAERILNLALSAGADAACLSGSGATLLALYHDEAFEHRIREAVSREEGWAALFPEIDLHGAKAL